MRHAAIDAARRTGRERLLASLEQEPEGIDTQALLLEIARTQELRVLLRGLPDKDLELNKRRSAWAVPHSL